MKWWCQREIRPWMAAALLLGALLAPMRVRAEIVNWAGATSGVQDWFVTGNWIPSRVPTENDDVRIAGNVANLQIAFSRNVTVKSLVNDAVLRPMADFSNFTALEAVSGLTNRGEIRLESQRSDRNTTVIVRPGGVLENTGRIVAIAANGGRRIIRGSINNRGTLTSEASIALEIENANAQLLQQAGTIRADGFITVNGGRVRLEGGALVGDIRLFNPDLSVADGMGSPSEVFVLGDQIRFRGNSSPSFTTHVTTDFSNFAVLRCDSGSVNVGRIILDAGRADRGSRIEFGDNFRNAPTGTIEIVLGPGGDRALNGTLINQGRVACINHTANFTGTYHAAGGTVEGNVSLSNSTIIPTTATANPTELLLYGDRSVLKGNNLQNLRLRLISDISNFTRLTVDSNAVNRGEILLESSRSDRSTRLDIPAGGALTNRGIIRAVAANQGGRFIRGSLVNFGTLRVDPAITLAIENNQSLLQQTEGSIQVDGTLQILAGRFRLLGGSLSGLVQSFDVEHYAAASMTSAAIVDVLGVESRLVSNDAERVNYHITSDFGNFTTLRLLTNGINRGKILLDAGRSDRGTRLLFDNSTTNTPSGRIEVLAGPGGSRDIQGVLVNQGSIFCTNASAEFRGTYQSDGGMIEGQLLFVGSTLVQTKDAPQSLDFLLYGDTTLESDNRANHRLHVISDFGRFSSLILGSNIVNRSLVSLESLRSDRTTFLRGADGLVRNGADGLIVADALNGGGREIVGALQNAGRIRLDHTLRIQGPAASHRNAGVIQIATNVLDINGASFVNLDGARIAGAGVLDVSGVDFTNSGGLYLSPSVQRMSVVGNFNQSASGLLDIDLANLSGPGIGHDLLEVRTGRATLAGKLSVHLADSFVPPADASFRMLTAQQGVIGRFASLTTVQVSVNRFLEVAYSANAVDLQARAGSNASQPPTIAVQPESQRVEKDAAVEFAVVVDGTGPFTYQWRFKGAPIPGTTASRLALAKAGVPDAGNYDVVVTGPAGTTTSQPASLGVNEKNQTGAPCTNCDFGDAPNSFGTSLASDGARHPNESATQGPYVTLGARVDLETDSLGNTGATLDDSTPAGQPDDEDGVIFTMPVEAGRTNEVRVVVVKSSYEFAFLNAWIDVRRDGSFDNGDDHIIPTTEVNSGLNTLRFWVPADAVIGDTISRFRLVGVNDRPDPAKHVGPTGPAHNGEVEDHPVKITGGSETGGEGGGGTNRFDFGDAPDTYRTTLAANGARHSSDFFKTNNPPYVILGTVIDLETNGVPSITAGSDDIATPTRPDDEEGVVFLSSLTPGKPASVQVVVNSRGLTQRFLNAWVDFAIDGTFTNAADKVISGMLVNQGTNVITFTVSSNAVVGNTFARFRITGANDPNDPIRTQDSFGLAANGEVEDYPVSISEISTDWGDAPETAGNFATARAKNGPRHVIVNGIHLGKRVDAESDGRPTAQARGDDNNQVDDEDGVIIGGPLTPGAVINVEVTASVAGKLEGWIDFNGNKTWTDIGENVFNSVNVNAGVNSLVVSVPATAAIGDAFARFRFSTRGGYGLLGEALDGEVEDYKLTVEQNSNCDLACEGSDFWLAYPGNQFPDPANPLLAQLRILGTPGNSVTVSIPGLGSNIVASIGANGSASVVLPNAVDLGSLNDGVLNRGIHVSSSANPVSVYAISRVKYSSDGYLGLPVEALGAEYVVGAYPNLHVGIPELSGSQFVVTATRPNTTVTITPACETGVRVARIPYSIVLTNAGDCYQLRNTNDAPADLTGTVIEADQPVAVFGGHQCTDVNSSSLFFCDYLVEQIPPVNRLGTEFFTAPFATRTGGDTVRVVAARNQTTLAVDGATVVLTNKGDVFTSFRTNATWITADKPVYTAQYASSSDLDGVTNADPFMVTVPGRSLFSPDITFATAGPNFVEHYITVIASELTSAITLNGTVTNPVFTAISSSGYRYARLKVAQGVHTLTASRPLGVVVYGWNEYESYAWPACLFFGDTTPPVLRFPTNPITRSLPTNEMTCTVALPDLRQQGVTTTDNCTLPLDVIVTQTPPAGTRVGVGTNKVVLSTRDSAGNLGSTTIDYIVTDPRRSGPYSINCPADMTVQCQSTNGAVVNFAVTGLRGCVPVPIETIPPSGSMFPRGTTEVVARIIAEGAVQAECRFVVTVTCRKRIELKGPVPEPGGPPNARELRLDFDEGENILEVSDSLDGPWVLIPNPKPGLVIKIAQEKSRFYRIR